MQLSYVAIQSIQTQWQTEWRDLNISSSCQDLKILKATIWVNWIWWQSSWPIAFDVSCEGFQYELLGVLVCTYF